MFGRAGIFLLAALALTGCADGAGPDGAALTPEESAALAEELVGESFAVTGEVGTASAAEASAGALADGFTSEFTYSRSCREGGVVGWTGTLERQWDWQAHTGWSDLVATKTLTDCGRWIEGQVVRLDGEIGVEAHHAWEGHRRMGLQTLDVEGSFHWAAEDGREGDCVVSLSARFDPETRTRTVQGRFCDREFDYTKTWNRDDD